MTSSSTARQDREQDLLAVGAHADDDEQRDRGRLTVEPHAAKLHGRRTIDYRYENLVPDRAAKWLRAVDRRLQQRRNIARDRTTKVAEQLGPPKSSDWIPAVSSAE